MDFESGVYFPRRTPPTKLYIHRAGLNLPEMDESISGSTYSHSLPQVLDKYKEQFSQYTFLLASAWSRGESFDDPYKEMIFDFAGFSDINGENWNTGNPEVRLWTVKNGIYVSEETTCGDSLILFGKEEDYRRTTRDLRYFMNTWPDLGIPITILQV